MNKKGIKKGIAIAFCFITLFSFAACKKKNADTEDYIIKADIKNDGSLEHNDVLYKDDNYKIVFKGISGINDTSKTNIFSLEEKISISVNASNNTDGNIKFIISDITINGETTTAIQSNSITKNVVSAGNTMGCTFDIKKTELNEDINKIRFRITGYSLKNDFIFSSGIIELNVSELEYKDAETDKDNLPFQNTETTKFDITNVFGKSKSEN